MTINGSVVSPAPVIVITNPKDSRYILPTKEPLGRIVKSTHIRLLIFSQAPIETVRIYIDNQLLASPVTFVGVESKDTNHHLPLWVAEWQPNVYADGQSHSIRVEAVDANGRIGNHATPFRLDVTPEPIASRVGEFILTAAFSSWVL
jgi:hypothetical protein